MLRKLLTETQDVDQSSHVIENIYKSLQHIVHRLEIDVSAKQKMIEDRDMEIRHLKTALGEKNIVIQGLQKNIDACEERVNGNRQLINKLLNDLERMQHDMEWYKRTYESRSLLGIIKDKIKYYFAK